jgi:signal transduction histidine kinase/ligand-binding sensor domain-containing protein
MNRVTRHGASARTGVLGPFVRVRILLQKVKRAERQRHCVIVLSIVLACCHCAYALDPSLDVSQYAHTAWKISDGFSKGAIWSITQTADGYLWLGTEFGLLRFDGVRAVPWEPPAGESLPSSDIRSLLVARDSSLWIGTYKGLVRWKDDKLTHYPQLDGLIVEWLLEDGDGTLWTVAGWTLSDAKLCRIQGGVTQCYGENGTPGSGVTAIYEDTRGNLWAGAMTGVWRWKPGPPKLYPMAGPAQRTYALTESDDGGILIARRGGITKLTNEKLEPFPLPTGLEFAPNRLLRDRDGSLWIGALVDNGLLHIHRGKADRFTPPEGVFGDLSGDSVKAFFEDREGSVWVATPSGLDRFRDFAIPTFSIGQGLSSRGVSSVLAGKDGNIWLGTSDGLNRWNKGQLTIYRKHSAGEDNRNTLTTGHLAEPGSTFHEILDSVLPHDEVTSLYEDNHGNVWVATLDGVAILKSERFQVVAGVPPGNLLSMTGDGADNVWISCEEGLLHLLHERVVDRIPWANFGRTEPARALLYDVPQGGLWIGFREGGVTFLTDGQLGASYTTAQGLAGGIVHSLYHDQAGGLWIAAEGGLSRIKDGRVVTLTSKNGVPCDNVHWMMEDGVGSVWLYLACGLVRIARSDLDAWTSNATQTIQATVFDSFDGVRSHPGISGYSPVVSRASDGKLWFLGSEGVSVIDPHHIAFNKLPPPVHIERIIADRKTYDASQGLRLPSLLRDVEIDFTALSFVAPEKVRFRYKLEGYDHDWQDAGNRRQAFYTNLPPSNYRFRVMACNNRGVWNEEGALLEFSIAPAFYQTAWFTVACGLLFVALLWLAYQLRVRQLALQFNRTLEARVSERTRIARELHDTLLQSFQGLLLRFQAVLKILPERPLEARQRLESTLDQAAAAITEGRDAVHGLRSSALETNELADGIKAIAEELTMDASAVDSPAIGVEIEGGPRNLNPIVRDETYRIASEAVRNAFRHAHARRIIVEIRYDKRQFRLRIRDDGKGIDQDTLRRQPAGHFGMPGMRERAEIVGGRLEVWSKVEAGTEIELTIPGNIAYDGSARQSVAINSGNGLRRLQ